MSAAGNHPREADVDMRRSSPQRREQGHEAGPGEALHQRYQVQQSVGE